MEIKEQLNKLREESLKEIVEIVENLGGKLYITDIDDGNSPILQEDFYDGNGTYTLDTIEVSNGAVFFDGSSAYDNRYWSKKELGVETLVEILDFLRDHKEEIENLKELINENED